MENKTEIEAAITAVLFIISSLVCFLYFSMSGIDLENLFSVAIGMDLNEIVTVVMVLLPFVFLFPLPFAILCFEGITTKRKHIWIPGFVGSIVSVIIGTFIFGTGMIYLLFSIGYVIAAAFCGHWVDVRFKELKSIRTYRSTTSAVSKSLLIINIWVIAGIFISIQTNPMYMESLLDRSISSYAAIAIEFGKHQIDSQIRDSIESQLSIQKEMYSNITANIANAFSEIGTNEIEKLRNEQLASIRELNMDSKQKGKLSDIINQTFDKEGERWKGEIHKIKSNLIEMYSEGLDDPMFREELIDRYYKEFSSHALDKEKMKQQIEEILRFPINIDNREIIIYDFLKMSLPVAVTLFSLVILNFCRRLLIAPLAAIYTSVFMNVFSRIGGRNEFQ